MEPTNEIGMLHDQADSSVRSSHHLTVEILRRENGPPNMELPELPKGKLTSLRKNPLTALANKKRRRRRRGRRVTRSIFQKAAASERASGRASERRRRTPKTSFALPRPFSPPLPARSRPPLSLHCDFQIHLLATNARSKAAAVHAWRMDGPTILSSKSH